MDPLGGTAQHGISEIFGGLVENHAAAICRQESRVADPIRSRSGSVHRDGLGRNCSPRSTAPRYSEYSAGAFASQTPARAVGKVASKVSAPRSQDPTLDPSRTIEPLRTRRACQPTVRADTRA